MDALDELAARLRTHIEENEPDAGLRQLMHQLLDDELEMARQQERRKWLRLLARARVRTPPAAARLAHKVDCAPLPEHPACSPEG